MENQNEVLRSNCPICGSERIEYRFIAFGRAVSACADCGHLFANPQDIQRMKLRKLYDKKDFQRFIRASTTAKVKFLTSDTDIDNISSDEKPEALAIDFIDTVPEPEELLKRIHRLLGEFGELYLFVPTLDSKSAKQNKQQWTGFKQKRLHFFSKKTIHNLLCKCGFGGIVWRESSPNGLFISCKAEKQRAKKVLTIIVPIYNEKNTVLELLNTVYQKDLSGMGLDKEIIIIESNSTDGTREIAERFAREHTDVKLILEDKPKGKGHAVRNGFASATGDFILIQDGDLEYDINDYDRLLLPMVKYQESFVLGSRHTGDWQMRKFTTGKAAALYMNIGHIVLTGLINIGCGTKLKDPFTMFKIFRRECLYGLSFDGNRFEIDWEILIKLIRKGFIPLEIPVSYSSRGMKEGKKIRIFKDPILCLMGFIKYNYLYRI